MDIFDVIFKINERGISNKEGRFITTEGRVIFVGGPSQGGGGGGNGDGEAAARLEAASATARNLGIAEDYYRYAKTAEQVKLVTISILSQSGMSERSAERTWEGEFETHLKKNQEQNDELP